MAREYEYGKEKLEKQTRKAFEEIDDSPLTKPVSDLLKKLQLRIRKTSTVFFFAGLILIISELIIIAGFLFNVLPQIKSAFQP